jgi:hypothetical protein
MYAEMGLNRLELSVFCPLGGMFFVSRAAFCPLGGFSAAFLQLFLRREITMDAADFFHVT